MALMEALLQIKAAVSGGDAINGLSKGLGGLTSTAGQVSKSMTGLVGSVGNVAGAVGALTPLLSAAGLLGMAKASIDAGNKMYDMSQKTGLSVEMLAKLKKAAVGSGTDLDAIGASVIKLSKNIAASVETQVASTTAAANGSKTQLANSLAGQVALYQQNQQRMIAEVKTGAERQTSEVKENERRRVEAIRSGMENALDKVRTGEQQQIEAINLAAEKRIQVLERETDSRLREINRRYRQEEKLLSDNYDDQRDRQQEAADDEQKLIERRIQRRYDAMEKAVNNDQTLNDDAREQALQRLSDQQEAELEAVGDRFKAEAKIRDRALRDQQEQAQQAIDDRRQQEEAAEKARVDAVKRQIQQRAKAEQEAVSKASAARQEQIRKAAAEEERIVREGATAATKAIQAAAAARVRALTDQSASAKDAFAKLGIELRTADGKIKDTGQVLLEISNKFKSMPNGVEKTALALQIFGKAGAGMIPVLNKGGEAIDKLKVKMTTEFAAAADEYDKKLSAVSGKIGGIGADIAMILLPVLDLVAGALGAVVDVFNKLPGPIKVAIGAVVLLTSAFLLLAPIISSVATVMGMFAGLQLGATIAGWLGAIGPLITGAIALFTGLMTWMTGTLLPFLTGFFSGPVGWTVLAIAAIVAMCIAFREPLGQFLSWLWERLLEIPEWFQNTIVTPLGDMWNGLVKGIKDAMHVTINWLRAAWTSVVNWWQGNIVRPISNMWNGLVQGIQRGMQGTVDWVLGAWTGLVNGLRGLANAFLSGWVNAINGVIRGVNNLIAAFNNLPGPDIGYVPTVPLPGFAEGGYVTRPMAAVVGEGGQAEYIVPENRMAAASAAYLSGARGTKVLSSTAAAPQSAGPVRIDIKTGPVMRTADGQDWVTVDDLERAMRATAQTVLGRVRTPAGRRATGIR